jgi:hypothetical protein
MGARDPPPPLLFLVDGLQAALPSVDHWIMWPRQAVVECGDRTGGGAFWADIGGRTSVETWLK